MISRDSVPLSNPEFAVNQGVKWPKMLALGIGA